MTVSSETQELIRVSSSGKDIKWLQTTKGKGKVVPVARGSTDGGPHPTVPRLAGITDLEVQQGTRETDPRPRYPPDAPERWIPPVSLDTSREGYKALEAMRHSEPCLVRNAPLVAGLRNRWTLDHLEKGIPDSGDALTVLCSSRGVNRFIECEESKNVFGSFYHVREPESQRLSMPLHEFAQCAQQWHTRLTYVKAAIMVHNNCGSAAMAKTSLRAQLEWAEPLGTSFQAELDGRIDWLWLHSLLHAQKHGPVLRVELQVGPPNGLLPARYECIDRLFAQVNGRRRILLIPPSQAFQGLYPYPVHHPYDRYSMVDLDCVNAEEWPAFSGVRGSVCIMEPGDVLFVPQFWFAHVQFLDRENADLVFHLHPGARIRLPQCMPLQVARLLEERVAEVEGVHNVRHWLSLIASGEDEARIDLDTLQGYKRTVLCEGVRDEVACNLGEAPGMCTELLQGMVLRRLTPTPWLNQNFREPLYLKDKPVRVEDMRSEEERKYPELFRRKLEGEGWSVPQSVSTIPIPGYNIPKGQDYRQL